MNSSNNDQSQKSSDKRRQAGALFKRSLPVWLSLAVLVAAVAILVTEPPLVGVLRNTVFDSYQKWKPREYQPAPVRFLDIDDESMARWGQWPWPRTLLADVVDRLRDLGAAAIVFDIVFAEPDRTSPTQALQEWLDEPHVPELMERLPDHDRVFAEALEGGKVVTGFVLTDAEKLDPQPPATKASIITSGDDPKPFLPNFSGVVRTLPELEAAADGNGGLNIAPERDGVVRRVQLLIRLGDTIYPTLTAEAIRIGKGGSNYIVKSSGASGESRAGGKTGVINIRIGEVPVATDSQGGIWLHYTENVPERSFPIWRLLEDELTEKDVSGNIVFIGTSAAGLKDLRFNALGEVTAGAEMHAQAVEQILQGTYLKRPDWAKATEILFMVLMWGALVVLIFRYGAILAALAGTVVVAGSFAGSWLAFTDMRLLLDPVTPGAMAMAVYLVCSVSRQVQNEHEKRWIRGAFASYISPNLVHYLIDNPGELELGGERRECSFVMTDLAGFTSLVERSEPEEVLALLNEYLDGMISVSLSHEGTIDRIVGDAVAVIFSAPILQPDHAQRAVACALAMDDFANTFRLRKQAEGVPIGIARVGVNTGTVTIGNVGGKDFVDYRALGDAVNTAARLETVNGQLGTRICVSGSTVALCPGFVGRPVGSLVLKGKSVGIDAYEPLTAEDAASSSTAAYLAAYNLLEQEAPESEATFASLVEEYPDDPLAKFHLNRLRNGDGGTTVILTSK